MNIYKNIFLILFLLLSTINFAQNTAESDCENGFKKIETELKSQKTVSYKIIYSQKLYTEESFEYSEGIIVLNDLNDQIEQKEIIETIARIGVENKLTKIIAFRNCNSIGLYLKKTELSTEQNNLLSNDLIAEMNIDLQKSLSKKERKKQKRKRDFIESVSKESCEKLTELGTDKLTMESFNQIVSGTSAKYAEKTMKVYEMSFEESVDKFLKDLMNHLMSDCRVVKDSARNQE
ncbi:MULTISPECIES: hypothetical protein [Winogradskyella]|uniref:hypothetical protein n=1 Tax=Winogradskyella TaxID=286104 RepID=UPI0015C79E41|nr:MULTISPECIES: hypothetical protein [Winogradskyella]QXP78742.1 hypothetical protein H0I32_16295 [Winogradskyella sp. HaHa_3_26]